MITNAHHQAIVGLAGQRLADKQAELDRVLAELAVIRAERDRFRDLFVQAMGAKWNEEPIQQMPLQTKTLDLGAPDAFEQMASRWSQAERQMYECWLRDEGSGIDEPERFWLSIYGGTSPLEVLQ